MKLQAKLKIALDETRLLILGAQIFLGFQFNGVFQDAFETLRPLPRRLDALAFVLIITSIALLIAPAMQHRLVERGQATARIQRITTLYAGWALLPLGASLGLDIFIVIGRHFGDAAAAAAGTMFFALAMLLWFVLAWLWRRDDLVEKPMKPPHEATPLHVKVEQMLTEARILIPGAQALLGFQMLVMLHSGFDKLPATSQLIHTAALFCIALAIILLMAPAAFHRIAYGGEDSEEFHQLGTRLVVAAAMPLAAGMTLDLYVAVTKATESATAGMGVAVLVAAILTSLWYVQPLALRRKQP